MIVCAARDCRADGDVVVTYLGVGGVMVQHRGRVLLTAPHFTNPPAPKVAVNLFGRGPVIDPDTALVRRLLPDDAHRAGTILVGHGHYDHLMDVPFIADSLARDAIVYGSPSTVNMLAGDHGLRPRLEAIAPGDVGTVADTGRWITSRDGGFRFMALASSHAPAFRWWFMRYDFAPGIVDTVLSALPRRASEWKAGETYAYIIDVLGDAGATVFRIYYQDAASDAPLGLPPVTLGGRRVDLAILTVPSAENARPPAPAALVEALQPRYVMASHWESFFAPQTEGVQRSPASNFGHFAASMRAHLPPDAEWSTPDPMNSYRFRVAPAR